MREIDVAVITETVAELCIQSNLELSKSMQSCIECSAKKEQSELGKHVFDVIRQNLDTAKSEKLPICQDTGMAVVFAELGQDLHITGGLLNDAINKGVALGYERGALRKSIVADPLRRVNTGDNTPAVIHLTLVKGDSLKITVAPKGFGSENMSAVKMFTPSATEDDIVGFVCDTVKKAGSNPCPPITVGVGIGGDFEMCTIISKKALIRGASSRNPDEYYANLEKRMLDNINKLGIGPQGFGGSQTALYVNIETFATHIAGLPVAVNIGCHVTRHKSVVL